MEHFLGNLKSSSWWISVVVVSVLLSWFAAYLKEWTDRLGSRVSRRWGERTATKAAARKALIGQLRANPHEQVMMGLDALDFRIEGFAHLMLGFACVIAGIVVPESFVSRLVGLGALFTLSGTLTAVRGKERFLRIREARSPLRPDA